MCPARTGHSTLTFSCTSCGRVRGRPFALVHTADFARRGFPSSKFNRAPRSEGRNRGMSAALSHHLTACNSRRTSWSLWRTGLKYVVRIQPTSSAFTLPLRAPTDFGLARIIDDCQAATPSANQFALPAGSSVARRSLTTHVVTRWYRAPEILLEVDRYVSCAGFWNRG